MFITAELDPHACRQTSTAAKARERGRPANTCDTDDEKARFTTLLQIELRRDPRAPAIARAATSNRCNALDVSSSVHDTLVLLVSELVSNAVLHSNAPLSMPILLTTSITDKLIRVTVTDTGEGFVPHPRDPNSRYGGYGLYLVDKTALRWGVERRDGTSVWFELSRVP